uniref:Nodulin-like domain-containing protein n=1 Tax=Heterorhabditis bacteriophora TaxID=37862 RepID=A0A1I7X905_HETBA
MKAGDVSIRMPRVSNVCPPGSPNLRLALVVLSIGAASHFLLYLDSVVDNLLPAAMPFLMTIYKTKEDAGRLPLLNVRLNLHSFIST